MTITTYLSAGLTSRGRVGIDAALTAKILDEPWYTDSADKDAHLDFINELVNNISSVDGLVMITPDNTTTIEDYGMWLHHPRLAFELIAASQSTIIPQAI